MKQKLLAAAFAALSCIVMTTDYAAAQVAPPPVVVVTENAHRGLTGLRLWPLLSTGCASGGLIASGIIVGRTQGRELTSSEALTVVASCYLGPLGWWFACHHYRHHPTPSTTPLTNVPRSRTPRHPHHPGNVFCGDPGVGAVGPVIVTKY